jgi:hypothetical protein
MIIWVVEGSFIIIFVCVFSGIGFFDPKNSSSSWISLFISIGLLSLIIGYIVFALVILLRKLNK